MTKNHARSVVCNYVGVCVIYGRDTLRKPFMTFNCERSHVSRRHNFAKSLFLTFTVYVTFTLKYVIK